MPRRSPSLARWVSRSVGAATEGGPAGAAADASTPGAPIGQAARDTSLVVTLAWYRAKLGVPYLGVENGA